MSHDIDPALESQQASPGGGPGPTVGRDTGHAPQASPGRGPGPTVGPDRGSEDDDEPRGIDLARQVLAGAQRGTSAKRVAEARKKVKTQRQRAANRVANLNSGRAGYSGAGPDVRDPQPAGAVLAGMTGELGWQRPLTEARLFTDWAALVGAEIAGHCQPESLRDGELRITATSTAWASQIRLLSGRLIHRLNTQLGTKLITRVQVSGPTGPSWKHGPRSVQGARGPRDTYG